MLSNGCLVGKVYLSPFKKFCFVEKYFNLQLESCSDTAVSAGIQMEKALGLYKHLSFLFIYSLSDRFTKNL